MFTGIISFLFSITHTHTHTHGSVTLQVGVAASYGLWAAASNFALFVVARIVGGAAKGNVSLAYSIMTDVSDERTRARGMVRLG